MKKQIGPVPLVYPVPIVLVGSLVDDRPNYATIGDCAIMGLKPALVAVSLGETHHTTRGILEHGTFSINVPTTKDLALVDHFGQVTGREVDKSKLVESFFGELETAPMIETCPVTLECRVLEEVSIEHRRIFIGGVVQTHVDEAFLTADAEPKIASIQKLDPILYALDNRYSSVGRAIGVGYEEGAEYRP